MRVSAFTVPMGAWLEKSRIDLPPGAVIRDWHFNGHGPMHPDCQSILMTYHYDVCAMPECMKCIRGYVREVGYPRGSAEEEVFV